MAFTGKRSVHEPSSKLLLLAIFAMTVFSPAVFSQQNAAPNKAKEHFDRGVVLLRERKFEAALSEFRESLRLSPEQATANANIGASLMFLGRPQESIVAFREAIRLSPGDGTFRTALCTALSRTNQHVQAIKECEEGVRLNPGSDHAQAALLAALKAAGKPIEEILRLADGTLSRFRESETVTALTAEIYFEAGNYAYVAELLRRLIGMRPDGAIYYGLLAETLLKLEQDEEALAAARTALRLEPANSYANYAMGLIFFELGQHEEAADSFKRVQPDIPRLKLAEYYAAMSEKGRGRRPEAIRIFESLVQRFPDEYTYQFQLGSILVSEGRYEDAIGPFSKARQLQPKSLEAAGGLGLALFESGRFEQAIPILEEGLRISPGNEIITMYLTVTRSRQQVIPRIDEMKRWAKEHPQDVKIRTVLVEALVFSRRFDEADTYVKEVFALRPKDVNSYLLAATRFGAAGKIDKAIDILQRSLEVGEDPSAYLGLAGNYMRLGDFERGATAYRKVFELKPNTPDVMVLFGIELMNHGKRREALDTFKRSLAIKPTNGVAIFNAGILSAKLGERDSALQYLEMLRPVRPDLARTLSRCLRLRIWG